MTPKHKSTQDWTLHADKGEAMGTMIAAGQEKEPVFCKDGGACHHSCALQCARQFELGSVPLFLSGLDDDQQTSLETAIRDKIKELCGESENKEDSASAEALVSHLVGLASTLQLTPGRGTVFSDNFKQPVLSEKKKLIDWSLIPLGANTNKGKLMSIAETSIHGRFFANVFEGQNCIAVELDELRLIEQTTFNHLPKGVQPPVVPGLVIEYLCVETENRGHFSDIGIQQNVYDNYLDLAKMLKRGAMLIAYRVIGVDTANANGWTDDPEQVK
jgi:hypothetical protein